MDVLSSDAANSSRATGSSSATGRQRRLRISEMFQSRQGEGKLTGQESSFIRLSGCNLRCWFCDTRYTSWEPDGKFQEIDAIVQWAVHGGLQHVVLTGGEPLLPMAVGALCDALRNAGLHLTIETAGTVDRPVVCDLLSLSPKLASSNPQETDFPNHPPVIGQRWIAAHQRRRWQPSIFRNLISRALDYQVKFVMNSPDDAGEIIDAISELELPPEHVWIMPQSRSPEELQAQSAWISRWCLETGFHFCDRAHLRWYGARRGT